MNVLQFPQIKEVNGVDEMLENAKVVYQDVVLIGYNEDGSGAWQLSKDLTTSERVFLLEALKFRVMEGVGNQHG